MLVKGATGLSTADHNDHILTPLLMLGLHQSTAELEATYMLLYNSGFLQLVNSRETVVAACPNHLQWC